jgi:RNA polymerase sigma factor (sigma-70 family)
MLPEQEVGGVGQARDECLQTIGRTLNECQPMTMLNTTQADFSTARLLELATAGDQDARAAIIDRYNRLVWTVVRAHVIDDNRAAEVVQTTWSRLLDHIAAIRDPEATGAWLATTARRESWRVLHQARRERPIDEERSLEAATRLAFEDEPEQRALFAELQRMVWRCVDDLPDHYRLLLQTLMVDPPPTYRVVSVELCMPIGSIVRYVAAVCNPRAAHS